MKLYTQARKYGAKLAVGASALALSGMAAAQSGGSGGTSPFDAMFAAVNFSTVAAAVGGLGVAVIGIALAYKGIDLVKRAVRKA